jgi:hypothetical protein
MQGLSLEDSEGYLPLLPNSPEGSSEGDVNNEVASQVGSSHSLVGFRFFSDSLDSFKLPPNPLLNIRQDACLLQMNSSRELVIVNNTRVPTGPNAESGVDDPLFQSESFRTPAHTARIFNPSSSPMIVRDLYGNLGSSPDQPMASQIPEMFIT